MTEFPLINQILRNSWSVLEVSYDYDTEQYYIWIVSDNRNGTILGFFITENTAEDFVQYLRKDFASAAVKYKHVIYK